MDERDLQYTNADGNMDLVGKTFVVREEDQNGNGIEMSVNVSDEESDVSAQLQAMFSDTIDEVWAKSMPLQALVEELCQFPFRDVSHKAELAQFHKFFCDIYQKIDAKMKDCKINDQEFGVNTLPRSFYADGQPVSKNFKESIICPPGYPEMTDDMMTELSNFIAENERSGDKSDHFLKPGSMVDSDVILAEMKLIQERSMTCKGLPSVYVLRPEVFSWLYIRGVDDALDLGYDDYVMFISDFVIFPLHFEEGKGHWALAIADFRKPDTIIITYYDSIWDRLDTALKERGDKSLKLLQKYFEAARERPTSTLIGKPNISKKNFCLRVHHDTPQQGNDVDCGVFVLKIADYVTGGLDLNFQQSHITYFRNVITWEIRSGRLLYIPQQAKVDSSSN